MPNLQTFIEARVELQRLRSEQSAPLGGPLTTIPANPALTLPAALSAAEFDAVMGEVRPIDPPHAV
jgi:hypothetical protein